MTFLKPLLFMLFFLICVSCDASKPAQANETINISIAEQELLTLLFLQRNEQGEEAQQKYFQLFSQLTNPEDIKQLLLMPIVKKLTGEDEAEFIALYAWKTEQAATQLREHPQYLEKGLPLRNKGWKELAYADMKLNEQKSYTLSTDKFYTVTEVWLKDEDKYQTYFNATVALREKLGAKIIFKQKPKVYSSSLKGTNPPSFIAIVEWSDETAIAAYTEDEMFKNAYPHLLAAMNKINWYQVSLPTGNEY